MQLLLGRGSLCSVSNFYVTSFSRKPALSAIWFSFMRRASRDRFAAMLFFLRRAQYLSSFKSSGTNCGRKRKREKEHKNVRTLITHLHREKKKRSSNGVYFDGWQIWRRKPRRGQQYKLYKWRLTCFRDFLIIGWGLSSSSEKARVRGSKSRPDEAIESATRDKPYCIRDESSESVARKGNNWQCRR